MSSSNGVRSDEIGHISSRMESTIRIPQYFDNPQIWFQQVEAVFTIGNIVKEEAKYYHLLASLTPSILLSVQDQLTISSSTPYSDLKRRIIKLKQKSKAYHLQELLDQKNIGDLQPTEILQKIKRNVSELQSSSTNDNSLLIRNLFIRSLPSHIQLHLTTQNDKDVDDLAEMANLLMELSHNSTINTVTSQSELRESQLVAEISILREEINALKQRSFRDATNPTICYYHNRFGSKAIKCQQPCKWNKNTSGKGTGSL